MARRTASPRRRHAAAALAALLPLTAALIVHGPVRPHEAAAAAPLLPVVTSISPTHVSAGGGTPVTIRGLNLGGVTTVDIGGNVSSDITAVTSSSVTAIAPVGAGTVDVRVSNAKSTSPATPLDYLTYTATGQLPITASGTQLELGGVPTVFTGLNAYEIATDWGTNAGCGGEVTPSQLNALFLSLKPHSLVRFDVFQGSMATDVNTGQLDWAPIDQVFYLAAADHVYLIPVIAAQSGVCDGDHWQDASWYSGGYRDVDNSAANSNGADLDPLSYWTYLQRVVQRYENSPALGMWEPMGEAEASDCPSQDQPSSCNGNQTCPDEAAAAQALRSFFDTVGGEIHALDPMHLVESGLLGGGQCGTTWQDYETVSASPGIDVMSVHDYYGEAPMGGDQWNGMALRFQQAQELGKPIITGESGIEAGSNPASNTSSDPKDVCVSFAQRTSDIEAKMQAQFAAGSSAFLVWNWVLDQLGPCSFSTGPGDPLMGLFTQSS